MLGLQNWQVFLQILNARCAFSPLQDHLLGDHTSERSRNFWQKALSCRSKQYLDFSPWNLHTQKIYKVEIQTSKKNFWCRSGAWLRPQALQHWINEKSGSESHRCKKFWGLVLFNLLHVTLPIRSLQHGGYLVPKSFPATEPLYRTESGIFLVSMRGSGSAKHVSVKNTIKAKNGKKCSVLSLHNHGIS